MMTNRQWLMLVILPFLVVLGIDQFSKQWAVEHFANPQAWGPLRFILLRNYGFAMGSSSNLDRLVTVVAPATLGAFLIFVLLVAQYLLPFKLGALRLGLTVLIAGVFANKLDRVLLGHVIDFVQLRVFQIKTGVFNIADVLQWVGVGLFLTTYVANGTLLHPPNERRNRRWIDPAFQLRYCLILVAIGGGFAFASGFLAYSYVNVLVSEISKVSYATASVVVRSFIYCYFLYTLSFLIVLAILGIVLSHRIVGPVKGFENYLRDLLEGKRRNFKMRGTDELQVLQKVADIFYERIIDPASFTLNPLKAGDLAPDLSGKIAFTDRSVNDLSFHGKLTWILFYRYATCPFCAVHLASVHDLIETCKSKGVQVLLVYESEPKDLENETCRETVKLIKDIDATVILDPSRKLYGRFSTRRDAFWFIDFRIWFALILAIRSGYKQSTVVGKVDQLPAHFLIGKDGLVAKTYYGRSFTDHIPYDEVLEFLNA